MCHKLTPFQSYLCTVNKKQASIMEENHTIPQSLDEAYRILDGMLDFPAKLTFLSGDDMHYSLGLWIRNEWLYSSRHGECNALMNEISRAECREQGQLSSTLFCTCYGDAFSTFILDHYKENLRSRMLRSNV